jgi:hypothetical protein
MSSQALASELRRMARDIRQQGRGIAFAQVVALTRTAQDVRAAEVREIDDSFDRPTPYTRNAVFVRPATKAEPEALVGLKDDNRGGRAPSTYLRAQIEGGRRQLKSFETSIRSLGVMDGTQFVVPGRAARLDAYGNIDRGQILQVLSQLRAFTGAETASRNLIRRDGTRDNGDRSETARRAAQLRRQAFGRAGGQYFAVGPAPRGGLRPGIYQRQVLRARSAGPADPRPRAVMLFVDRAQYEQRFDFWDAGLLELDRAWPRRFDEALAQYADRPGAPA